MKFLKEFKEFAVKGNALDMAVGIIIGGVFTPVVKSLVADLIMPPIGLLIGNIDFADQRLTLREAREGAEAVTLNWGTFVTLVITFIITAFAVFLLVKGMNSLKRAEEAAPTPPPNTKDCPQCLMPVPLAATKCGHCTSAI